MPYVLDDNLRNILANSGYGGYKPTSSFFPTSQGTNTADPGLPGVSYNPKNPNQTLADITKREQYRYDKYYVPFENRIIGSVNDRSIVEGAQDAADTAFEDVQQRNLRTLSRYGVSLSPIQQAQFRKQSALAKSLTNDVVLNEAELAQRERNDALRRELINIGRGVAQEASSSFSDASSLQAQREAANRQAKAQSKAQAYQTAGSLAAAAIIAFL